jgi:SAM-dependent methyltransferase
VLKPLFEHPYTRGLSLDDPRTTAFRQKIIQEKAFLKKLYFEWYSWLITQIPEVSGNDVLELGAGGGFLKSLSSNCITSEVFACPGVDLVLDGRSIPFSNCSLRAILMIDVFHHIPDVAKFLAEAERTLLRGGIVAMIEPWMTSWSKFIYRYFHSEPFDPKAKSWQFPCLGPLSSANGALPWIVFDRDRNIYETRFRGLRLKSITLDHPFSYLASGGIAFRSIFPSWSFSFLRKIEHKCSSFMESIAMFAKIVLIKG